MYGSAYFSLNDTKGYWYKIFSVQNISNNNNVNITFNATLSNTSVISGSCGWLYFNARASMTGAGAKKLYVDETTGYMTSTDKIAVVENIQDGKLNYDIYVFFYTQYQGWRLKLIDISWLTGLSIAKSMLRSYIVSQLQYSDLLDNLPIIDKENILSITYASPLNKS